MDKRAFIFLILFSFFARAQKLAQIEAPSNQKIIWYQPQFIEGGRAHFLRTLFSGKTTSSALVFIANDEVSVIQKNRAVTFLTKKLLTTSDTVRADANGYFEMILDLPPGSVQLPIRVQVEKVFKLYQLNLEVSAERVEMSARGQLATSPTLTNPAYIWSGVGFNSLILAQDSSDGNVHIGFSSFKAPSLFLEGLYPLTSNWGLIPSYKVSPGSVTSPSNINLKAAQYNWAILMIEARYSQRIWKSQIFQRPAKYFLRFGMNQHTVPFWVRGPAASADIVTNMIMMASIGGQVDYELSNSWVLTSLLRYQYPLLSGSLFTVKPKISLDAGLGAYYRLENQWNVGAFYYGQYHRWSFTHLDPVIEKEIKGDQTILFSNIELRAGYVF